MVVRFLIRPAVVIGVVYYTKKTGFWGNPEETEQLYNNIKDQLRPHIKRLERQLPFEVPALPRNGKFRFLAQHYYNKGVKNTFHFIEMLPCYLSQLITKAMDTLENL